jgi:hypothetical protein
MHSAHITPIILISILIGLLFGLLVWGFWRARHRDLDHMLLESHDDLLLGLLVLGAFAMGVFLTYALVNFNLF